LNHEKGFFLIGNEKVRPLDGSREVNPVRNSSRCDSKPSGTLNPVRDLSLNGINLALRGGTPYGAEPGIILKWVTPLQPPAQRASLRGMSPSGAEPGPEGAAGHYF